MSYPTLESYREFRKAVLRNQYSMDPTLFALIPPILTVHAESRIAIEVMGCDLGYVVRVLPSLENRLGRSAEDIDWERCCRTSNGMAYLLDTLGISRDRFRTYPATRPKSQQEYERLCVHNIQLMCHRETFTKPEYGLDRVTRITPEHPHPQWRFWELEPVTRPFGCVVVEDGELIASSAVERKIGLFDGNIWSVAVGVDTEWRRQGIGRLVSAAATEEVLNLGGLACWSTQADNLGSLHIAKSLGYREDHIHITIPRYVVEDVISI